MSTGANRKYHYVYKITNNLNGMEYIGVHSTDNLQDGYFGSGTYLRNAIKKYGKSNFTKAIIEECPDREIALEKEKEFVNPSYVRNSTVYNLVLGGNTPQGRVLSIKKFKRGEQNQLFIDFNNTIEQEKYKEDYETPAMFYIDEYEYKNYENELKASQSFYETYAEKSLGIELNYKISFLILKSLPDICKSLTKLWNDKKYHSDALKMFKILLQKNLCNLSNTSIIRLKEIERAA